MTVLPDVLKKELVQEHLSSNRVWNSGLKHAFEVLQKNGWSNSNMNKKYWKELFQSQGWHSQNDCLKECREGHKAFFKEQGWRSPEDWEKNEEKWNTEFILINDTWNVKWEKARQQLKKGTRGLNIDNLIDEVFGK